MQNMPNLPFSSNTLLWLLTRFISQTPGEEIQTNTENSLQNTIRPTPRCQTKTKPVVFGEYIISQSLEYLRGGDGEEEAMTLT